MSCISKKLYLFKNGLVGFAYEPGISISSRDFTSRAWLVPSLSLGSIFTASLCHVVNFSKNQKSLFESSFFRHAIPPPFYSRAATLSDPTASRAPPPPPPSRATSTSTASAPTGGLSFTTTPPPTGGRRYSTTIRYCVKIEIIFLAHF